MGIGSTFRHSEILAQRSLHRIPHSQLPVAHPRLAGVIEGVKGRMERYKQGTWVSPRQIEEVLHLLVRKSVRAVSKETGISEIRVYQVKRDYTPRLRLRPVSVKPWTDRRHIGPYERKKLQRSRSSGRQSAERGLISSSRWNGHFRLTGGHPVHFRGG